MSTAVLLLSIVLAAPAPPTAAEMDAANNDLEVMAPLLQRWLDDYPASARGWSEPQLAQVLARVVGLGQGHHAAAPALADRVARASVDGESPPDTARIAEAHSLAARVALARGENSRALELLGKGLGFCNEPAGEQEATYCSFLLRDRALTRMRLDQPVGASKDLERAGAWLEPHPRSRARVAVLNSAADVACWRGDAERCLGLYGRATEVAEALYGVDSEVAAYGYLGIGWAAALGARWGEARAAFERAEAVWAKTLGASHARLSDALVEYGELLRRAGNAAEARGVFRRAVALREARLGPEAFDLPRALDGLALAALELGDLEQAAEAAARSSTIRARYRAPTQTERGRALRMAARLAEARGELREARRLSEQALGLLESSLGEAHLEVAEMTLKLAELELDRRPERALARISRTRDALAAAFGEQHPALARAWWLEARVRQNVGGDSVTPALRAERIARRHRRLVSPGLAESDLLRSRGAYPRALDLAVATLLAESAPRPARVLAVWRAVALSRTPVLEIERARRAAVVEAGGADAAELEVARRALGRLQTLAAGDDATEIGRRLAAARRRVERAERTLSGRLKSPDAGGTELTSVLRELRVGEALVAFRLSDDETRLAAFIAKPRSPKALAATRQAQAPSPGDSSALDLSVLELSAVDLGAWPPLAQDLDLLQAAMGSGIEAPYRSVASRVRERLIDPLASTLEGAERWFIVPDGRLALLPFGALATRNGHYLLERASIHQMVAETDLFPAILEGSADGSLLAVGGPAFGEPATTGRASAAPFNQHSQATGERRLPTFEALPEARQEARWIRTAWLRATSAPAHLLLGSAATEESWRAKAPQAAVLHLATHGFFVEGGAPPALQGGSRGVGSVVAADGDAADATADSGSTLSGSAWSDSAWPGALSGFAMAGANRSAGSEDPESSDAEADDGLVTAEEIRALDLQRTRLVVLSFCDGGLGSVQRGEGVFGLSRSFRIAGARAMVLTLAPVGDRESRLFMELLYTQLLGGAVLDQALRRAALGRLEARRRLGENTHPIHWGAWVSTGHPASPLGPGFQPPEAR